MFQLLTGRLCKLQLGKSSEHMEHVSDKCSKAEVERSRS